MFDHKCFFQLAAFVCIRDFMRSLVPNRRRSDASVRKFLFLCNKRSVRITVDLSFMSIKKNSTTNFLNDKLCRHVQGKQVGLRPLLAIKIAQKIVRVDDLVGLGPNLKTFQAIESPIYLNFPPLQMHCKQHNGRKT